MRMTAVTVSRLICLVTFVVLLGAMPGCKILSVMLPQKGEAEYVLTKEVKYAVFVDDYMSPLAKPAWKQDLADALGKELVDNEVINEEDLVDSNLIFDQSTEGDDGKKLSIQHIGKNAGAEYVIYLNLVEFTLQSDLDTPLIKPKASLNVKLIDVETGERIWPIEGSGRLVDIDEQMQNEDINQADLEEWTQKLIDSIAVEVSHLFYDYLIR